MRVVARLSRRVSDGRKSNCQNCRDGTKMSFCVCECLSRFSSLNFFLFKAQQLHSVYRWSVSGTPIQRGLEDLQGLCVFLGKQYFQEKR